MGRTALPIETLKSNGTYRPSVHGAEEDKPQLPIESPKLPTYVASNAVEYFNDVVGWGLEMSIVTQADSVIIGLLSNEMAEWVELDAAVKSEGFMVKLPTATGFMQQVVNPKIKIRDDKLKVILKMLGELGLSPAARSKVQVHKKNQESQSALGQFLSAATRQMEGRRP